MKKKDITPPAPKPSYNDPPKVTYSEGIYIQMRPGDTSGYSLGRTLTIDEAFELFRALGRALEETGRITVLEK